MTYYFMSFYLLQTLAPEWKLAAQLYDADRDGVVLAAVDATVSPALAARCVLNTRMMDAAY